MPQSQPQFIRILEDREGSPNHTHVYFYRAGEVYSDQSNPWISPWLMEGFIASGHAVAVDDNGNPIGGSPADRRETKPTGPDATKEAAGDIGADTTADTAEGDAGSDAESDAEANAEQQRRMQLRRAAKASNESSSASSPNT